MGALLAFLPRDPGGAPGAAFDRARAWIEQGKGLAVAGEAGLGAAAVKFLRRNGSGAPPAVSERGWLVAAGSWACDGCDGGEALLRRLEEEGDAALDGVDGSFAIVWWDAAARRLVAAPDDLGRLHVYFAEAPEGVYVSTSSVALAAAVPSSPDPVAVWELLATGTIYEERTPFDHVRRMIGLRRYRFEGGRLAGETRRDAPLPPPAEAGGSVAELAEACRDACERFLPGAARPLADLTGGQDSRLVLGSLLDAGRRCDVTVTGAPHEPDARIAAKLAGLLGLELLRETREPPSFERVLAAAARVDGEYDAIEYAGVAGIHEPHARDYDLSVNGSGGEVFRNYWWEAGHLPVTQGDAAGALLRRFTHAAVAPVFLAEPCRREPAAHFREMLERELAPRRGDSFPALFDHAYLHLRMQCWQGAIASATNEIWPNFSPLLLRRTLDALYRVPWRLRLGNRLIHALLARFPRAFSTCPLETGFPPLDPTLSSYWRFVPGALRWPASFARRVRARLGRGRPDPRAADAVRRLLREGADDYLAPGSLALAPLLDRDRLARFLDEGRATGRVSYPVLGRLISLEHAFRAARA